MTTDDKPWAVILGASSGMGLASARRLARGGFNLLLAHKDREGTVETALRPHFDWIRDQGAALATLNADLSEEDARAAFLELARERAGRGGVRLLLHAIAAGSLKRVATAPDDAPRAAAIRSLAESLQLDPKRLREAINAAFHEKGCDALFTLADTRIPDREGMLEEGDLARTLAMMGSDFLLWGRALLAEGLLAKRSRLVALSSEGSTLSWKGYAAIAAAKAALEALNRAMAVEMAPYGVRTCVIQAGITDTPSGNAIPRFDLLKAQARLRNPFGRLTTPEDVAEVVYALSLPLLDWTNGTVIRVDGGESVAGL